MKNLNEIAEQLSNLTANEATELLDIFKEEYNIKPVCTEVFVPEVEKVVEKQTAFDVKLIHAGGQKLQVVKALKGLTSLSLMDSKKLTDAVPAMVKEGVSESEAEQIRTELENLGATVEVY
jgi:large subunit ribosomal protein L7/L12